MIEYFGTNLDEYGHYLWQLEGSRIFNRNLNLERLPFNPEEMPRREKGEIRKKGDVEYYQESGYSILAIEGSCIDERWGTKSVFFIKDQLNKKQMINIIKTTTITNNIIMAMPFKVYI